MGLFSRKISIIVSIPGGGKGTQIELMQQSDLSLIHIKSSGLIDKCKESNQTLWERMQEFREKGKLVPDDIINEIFTEGLRQELTANPENGFALDGYPRTQSQVKALIEFLKSINRLDDAVVLHIKLADTPGEEREIAEKRLIQRIECMGQTPHTLKPSGLKDGRCWCGAEVMVRQDDSNREAMLARFDIYENQVKPAVDKIKESGRIPVIEVNGNMSEEEIHSEIMKGFRIKESEQERLGSERQL